MTGEMHAELFWLTCTALMTALFWIPYIVTHLLESGVVRAVTDASLDTTPKAAWAQRAKRAHYNAVENLAVFAPLAISAVLAGADSATTATACAVYFFARLVHYPVATFGVPVVRTVAFAIGSVAQIVLAIAVLAAM
jgi:uncharacterized MAPEG superfamily protein